MFKKIGLAVLAIFAVLLGYAAVSSPDYAISRQITINAPAEKIFPLMNNQKLAEQWGPWLETDPDAKMSYSGTDEGVGSKASWDSSGNLGTGSATIVESVPNQRVAIQLEYTKPMNMSQHSLYLIEAQGDQSVVTWRVEGKNGFLSRFMCIFVDMDGIVGGMFEKGLSNLKALVEEEIKKEQRMSKINHCLWFDNQAEEAARFYCSVFKKSKLGRIAYYGDEGFEFHGRPKGSVMTVEFEIEDTPYLALNGGPIFKFNESYSIIVNCETQDEIDYYWKALTAGGGEEGHCGWLKDKFGVSWQVNPTILTEMVLDPDHVKSQRVTRAYLQMKKFDIAALKRAYEGK